MFPDPKATMDNDNASTSFPESFQYQQQMSSHPHQLPNQHSQQAATQFDFENNGNTKFSKANNYHV